MHTKTIQKQGLILTAAARIPTCAGGNKKSKAFSFLSFDVELKMNRSVMRSKWEGKDQNDLWEQRLFDILRVIS